MVSKTKKQLCQEYNISLPTLRRWLSKIPDLKIDRGLINPSELEKIYNHLGKA